MIGNRLKEQLRMAAAPFGISLLIIFHLTAVSEPMEFSSPNEESYGGFGSPISGVPDVNGDGRGDVVIGAPYEDIERPYDNSGRAYVYDGSTQSLLHVLESPEGRSNARFGCAVAGITDVNGDGKGDIVVGACDRDTIGMPYIHRTGAAHIFDGATGDQLHLLVSPNEQNYGNFGNSVSAVPDLSGDGREDVVVGAYKEDVGDATQAGRAYIFDGATGALLHSLTSPAPESTGHFGKSVSGIPDLNGDGQGDVIVGAEVENPERSSSKRGRTYIFSGSSGELLRTLVLPEEDRSKPYYGDSFGDFVAGLWDVSGDGRGDIGVGADNGKVYIFDGSGGQLLKKLASPNEEKGGGFGIAFAGIPDVNEDGRGDLIVGAKDEDLDSSTRGAGRAYVLDGSTGVLLQTLVSPNAQSSGGFGSSVAGLPDANGDGRWEALVGAIDEKSVTGLIEAGRAYVFWSPFHGIDVSTPLLDFGPQHIDDGPTPSLSVTVYNNGPADLIFEGGGFELTGPHSGDFSITNFPSLDPLLPGSAREVGVCFDPSSFGDKEAYLTITTNDLYDDVLNVLLAGTGIDPDSARILRASDEVVDPGFGLQVCGIGDVNGDALGDVAVGTQGRKVHVIDGSTGLWLHSAFPPDLHNIREFGEIIAGVPDVNGDGVDDLSVSAVDSGYLQVGRVYVFDGANGSMLYSIGSPNIELDGSFGCSIAGISDVNGDGRGDMVVGADSENPDESPTDAGRVYIFDGSNGSLLYTLLSPNEQEAGGFGACVSGIPDLNGDGRCDLVVLGDGVAYVFDGVNWTLLHELVLPNRGGYLRRSVAGLPDVNGDGLGDIAAVCNESLVHIYDGASGELWQTLRSPNRDSGGLLRVSGVFDTNGDGYGDVVVGAEYENEGTGLIQTGRAYLFSGFDGSVLNSFIPPNQEFASRFGGSISGIPDANGDGLGDVVIGAYQLGPPPSPEDAGRAYIFYSPFPVATRTPTPTSTPTQSPSSTPTTTPTMTPTPFVWRIPADGGPTVHYNSLREALAETEAGDELLMTGQEIVETPLTFSVPNVHLHAPATAALVEGDGFSSEEPLLIIGEAAAGTRISGLSFLGLGIHGAAKATAGGAIDFELEVPGASAIRNNAGGTLIGGCRFSGFGSGGLGGGAAVTTGFENDQAFIRLDSCRFELNVTALRVYAGAGQVYDTTLKDSLYADCIVYSPGAVASPQPATLQIMDSTFTSSLLSPPMFRIFAAGSPSDLEVTGCWIGPAQGANVVFGDGDMTLAHSVVYNLANFNHDLLTCASLWESETAGVPTSVTIDHCDLYNHGTSTLDWIFADGQNALVSAGETVSENGDPIALCTVNITNSILTGAADEMGVRDMGVAFHQVYPASSASRFAITNCVITLEGEKALAAAYNLAPQEASAISTSDPYYAAVASTIADANLDFHYSSNSPAATLDEEGGPVGAIGPDESLGATLSVPQQIGFDISGGVANIPVSISELSEVAEIDLTIAYNETSFDAGYPVAGPTFDSGMLSAFMGEGAVEVEMTPDPIQTQPGGAVLFLLPLTPVTDVDASPIEFSKVTVLDLEGAPFRVQALDGEITVTAKIEPGNVDFNSRVDILDVVKVLRHIVKVESLSETAKKAADVVNPGELVPPDYEDSIGIEDALAIYEMVTGATSEGSN